LRGPPPIPECRDESAARCKSTCLTQIAGLRHLHRVPRLKLQICDFRLLAQLLVTGVSSVQHGIWQAPTMPSDSGAYRGRS
jgi:hypothetical protein